MVTCPDCYESLPYDCVCNRTDEEKLNRFQDLSNKEIELLKAVLRGFRPKIKVEHLDEFFRIIAEEIFETKVRKRDNFLIELRCSFKKRGAYARIELLGADNELLYRRIIEPGDCTEVSWILGVERRPSNLMRVEAGKR